MHVLRLTENLLGFYDGREPRSGRRADRELGRRRRPVARHLQLRARRRRRRDRLRHPRLARARPTDPRHDRAARRPPDPRGAEPLAPRSHRRQRGLRRLRDHREPGDRRAARRASRARSRRGRSRGHRRSRRSWLPTTLFDDRMALDTEHHRVELVQLDIHSRDATVIRLPEAGLLLAGDTVEDTVTYVDEPDRLERHLDELERMRRLGARRILPNHGSRETIERGGYAETLIDATAAVRARSAPTRRRADRDADRPADVRRRSARGRLVRRGSSAYQRVHEGNLAAVANRG